MVFEGTLASPESQSITLHETTTPQDATKTKYQNDIYPIQENISTTGFGKKMLNQLKVLIVCVIQNSK